jgi:hypothetical protein
MNREVILEDAVVREMQEPGQIDLSLDRLTALTVIGHIQLALRHPANRGASSVIAREFITRLAERLPPAMRESVAMGFDPAYDRERPRLP